MHKTTTKLCLTTLLICLLPWLVFASKKPHVPNQLILKTTKSTTYTKNLSLSAQKSLSKTEKSIAKILTKYRAKEMKKLGPTIKEDKKAGLLNLFKKKEKLNNLYLIEFEGQPDLSQIITELQKESDIVYAQPNYILKTFAFIPNDSLYATYQDNLDLLELADAWTISTGNTNTVIAIIDTGVSYDHPDLINRIWNNPTENASTSNRTNGIDDDNNGYIDDYMGWDFVIGSPSGDYKAAPNEEYGSDDQYPDDNNGHGTHVSGICAAETNNSIGIAGVAFNASIMPVRAAYSAIEISTNKTVGIFNTSDLINAIKYAADNNAHIINMSFGGVGPNAVLKEAVEYAQGKGALIVAAAGNEAINIDTYSIIPATYANVLTVSGTNNQGTFMSTYSNYGNSVEIAAPGSSITSTYLNNQYENLTGTSMSAPHISGLAALLKGYDNTLSAQDIFQIICWTATSIEDIKTPEYGYGVANARLALSSVYSGAPPPATDPLLTGSDILLKSFLNYPNPFNPSDQKTKITYSLSNQADIKIKIYSLNLDLIKSFTIANSSLGYYEDLEWDGRDSSGDIVPNGVYPTIIEATSTTKQEKKTHKIVVVR